MLPLDRIWLSGGCRNGVTRDFVIGTSLNGVLVVKLGTMRWVGRIVRMTAKGNACRVLVEKPEGKMPLGTRRRRWENDKGSREGRVQ